MSDRVRQALQRVMQNRKNNNFTVNEARRIVRASTYCLIRERVCDTRTRSRKAYMRLFDIFFDRFILRFIPHSREHLFALFFLQTVKLVGKIFEHFFFVYRSGNGYDYIIGGIVSVYVRVHYGARYPCETPGRSEYGIVETFVREDHIGSRLNREVGDVRKAAGGTAAASAPQKPPINPSPTMASPIPESWDPPILSLMLVPL